MLFRSMMLEDKVGRGKMDGFLKTYFDTHRFKTLTTEEFIYYLNKNLIDKYQVEVDIDEWIYGPGIPENVTKVTTEKFVVVNKVVALIKENYDFGDLEVSDWTTHEWLHFIRQLPIVDEKDLMKRLDNKFNFSNERKFLFFCNVRNPDSRRYDCKNASGNAGWIWR